MINFVVRSRKNFKLDKKQYFPTIAASVPVKYDEVVQQVEKFCTLSESDVAAGLEALEHVIIDALKQGKSVRLGTLGSFRPTIAVVKSREHEEDVSASDIKFLRCRFTPSGKMARSLMMKELKFKLLKSIGAAVGGKEVGNA